MKRLYAFDFDGTLTTAFDALCRRFADDNACLIRPKAKALLSKLFAQGESVCVVSASIDNWVRPFFTEMARASRSAFCVLGTQVETDKDGRLTGRFLSNNCYGAEKVERLCKQLPELTTHRCDYHIEAFGDSRGDRELLAFADKTHYKPFR